MPGKRSRDKGVRIERELVRLAQRRGLEAMRAWGSDGRTLGENADVDVRIEQVTVQVKARHRLPKWLKSEADVLVLKETRGPWLAVIPLEWLLAYLKLEKEICNA